MDVAAGCDEAVKLLGVASYDLAFLDIMLGAERGTDLLRQIKIILPLYR